MKQKKTEKNTSLNLYIKLMRTTNTVTEKIHGRLSEYKLSISQFGVLEALCHLGPLCQKDLGAKILKTSGNITMVIDNLEKRDLVVREKDPKDRRKMTINLTKEGFRLIDSIFPGHREKTEEVFSALSEDEKEILSKLLKKLSGIK